MPVFFKLCNGGKTGWEDGGQPGSASRVMEANPFPEGQQQLRNRFGPNVYVSPFLTNAATEKPHGLWDS